MENVTMLYKHPGPHRIHDDNFDYIIVHDEQVEDFLAEGWSRTTPEALERSQAQARARAQEQPQDARTEGIKPVVTTNKQQPPAKQAGVVKA